MYVHVRRILCATTFCDRLFIFASRVHGVENISLKQPGYPPLRHHRTSLQSHVRPISPTICPGTRGEKSISIINFTDLLAFALVQPPQTDITNQAMVPKFNYISSNPLGCVIHDAPRLRFTTLVFHKTSLLISELHDSLNEVQANRVVVRVHKTSESRP